MPQRWCAVLRLAGEDRGGVRTTNPAVTSRQTALTGFFHCIGAFVESLLARCLRRVNASEGTGQIRDEFGIGSVKGSTPGYDYVVEAIFCLLGCKRRDRSLEAAPDTIADDRVAELLCHREAETRPIKIILGSNPCLRFKQTDGNRTPSPTTDGEVFRAGFERD